MKKLLLTFCLLLTTLISWAEKVEIDGIYYSLYNNGTALVVSSGKTGVYYTGAVNIPEEVLYKNQRYEVVAIGSSAFHGCSELNSVVIPNSISDIGDGAFGNCTKLASIIIPNSVTRLGFNAFYGCTGLTTVTLSNKIDAINSRTFYGCSSLTSIFIPESVTSIGNKAFYGCTSLYSITIPNAGVAGEAFRNCTALTSINLANCTMILDYAFHGCTSLTDVGNMNNCKKIGYRAFEGCTSLTSVGDMNSCTTIMERAFDGCISLTSVGDMKNCNIIHKSAFVNCSSLISVGCLDNCTSIGGEAFYGCSSLERIYNLNNCTSIESGGFGKCSSLTSVGDLRNCTSIGSGAFSGCTSLAGELNLNNLSTIEEETFKDCSSLTGVGDLRNCESIGKEAFCGCSSLTGYLDLRNTKTIGDRAFKGAALTEVNMGALVIDEEEGTVEEVAQVRARKVNTISGSIVLGASVFEDNKMLTFTNDDLQSIQSAGSSIFRNCTKITRVFLPNLQGVIGHYAFYGCTGLTNVELGPNCTEIGQHAFQNCTSLKKIIFYDNLKTIGQEAFTNDKALKGSKIWNKDGIEQGCLDLGSVEYVGQNAFENCTSLDSVFFGAKITSRKDTTITVKNKKGETKKITEYKYFIYEPTPKLKTIMGAAFKGCISLKNVCIPYTLEELGNQCFQNCKNLKTVVLSQASENNKLIDIKNKTFNGCESLEVFAHGGKKIRDIQNEAFFDCKSLKILNVTGIKGIIDKLAFGNCEFNNVYYGDNGKQAVGEVKTFSKSAYAMLEDTNDEDECCIIIGRHQQIAPDAMTGTPWMENNKEELVYLCDNLIKYNKITNYADIIVDEGTVAIGKKAFYNSNINSITLPSSLTTIYDYAFRYCDSLKDIYCYAATPPVVENGYAFSNYTTTLHVPEGCSDAYMQAEVWKNFTNIVETWSAEHQQLLNRYDELMQKSLNGLHSIIATEEQELIQNVSQLSSPNTESTEGSLAALIDANTSTYWHSTWKNGSVAGGTHYLQVELVAPADMECYATFTRRKAQNDHVTNMSIYGTNNANAAKGDCEELLTFACPYTSNTETITSPHFQTKGYRYLRLYANTTTSGNGYWHMSELQLYGINNVSSELATLMEPEGTNLQTVIDQQSNIKRKDISEENYNALKEAYDAFVAKLAELSGQNTVIITAKSYSREYGAANPTFEYTVVGSTLEGKPEIVCEATATSPVGEYPIVIRKGSVTNDNDTYVNGVLTITKAPLSIAAGKYTMKQGETLPEFTLTYSGFKNNETKDVLTKQPVVSCEATAASAPGEYPVTVSGAEAQNYAISYTNGKLTITGTEPNKPLVETFTLNCKRGYVGYDGESLYGTTETGASQFAIIEYGETNYLYDATHKAFVIHTTAAKAGTTGNNALESSIDFSKAVTGLKWGETGFANYPWYLEDSFGNWMNMDQKPRVYMNTWKNFENANGGNTYQKTIVDVSYDATEALEMLDNYFNPQNFVVFEFTEPGNVVSRSEALPVKTGSVINEVPSDMCKDYCIYDVTQATMAEGENVVKVRVSCDLPFETSSSFESATWYLAKVRYNYYLNMGNSEPYYPTATMQETNNFQWAFMGTPHTGFVILNKAAGADKCLTKVDSYALMRQSNERWELIRNAKGGFNVLRRGSDLDYITQYGGNTGYLGFWVDTRGRADVGGMWLLEEVTTNINAIDANSLDAMIYDLNGNRLSKPQRGVNIIRMKGGNTRKVLVK